MELGGQTMLTIDELKAKADELEIPYEEDTDSDTLSGLIKDKEDANKKKDPTYLESEAKKAFEERDKAKKARRVAESEIKKLKEQMVNTVDKEQYEDLRTQLQELRQKELEREEEEERKKMESASEIERKLLKKDKDIAQMKKEFEERIKTIENTAKEREKEAKSLSEANRALRTKTLENEILIAAERSNALRPSQVVRLVKGDFEWDDTYNKYVVFMKDDKGKIVDYKDIDEYIADFLKREDNDNLVKSDVATTSFNQKRGDDDTNVTKKKDYKPTGNYDPKDPAIIKEADRAGYGKDVERWIRIKEIRDKRLNQKKEREEKLLQK